MSEQEARQAVGPDRDAKDVADPKVLLAHHLKKLKLPTVLAEYDKQARQCAEQGIDHPRYLLRLAELELIERERRMVERRVRAARFPASKSLDSFDFKALPSLNKVLVMELARGEFIIRRENIIALGPCKPDSYCPSCYVLIIPADFVADYETADVVDAARRLHF